MNLAIDVASGEKPTEELVGGAIKSLFLNDDVNLILVGKEKFSWERLVNEAVPKLMNGTFDEKYQNELIKDFNDSLK